MSQQPYLSIVVVGRNDDYGGDFNARLHKAATWLALQAEKYKLDAELIVVNYNPIADKPSLYEAIDWHKHRRYLQIRIITVPPEVHQSVFVKPDVRKTVPLFEYPAKNVGIRRARGEFILCANPDIIFDPKIIAFFAKKKLQHDTFYRTDRCDFRDLETNVPPFPRNYIRQIQNKTHCVFLKGNKYDKPKNKKLFWWLQQKRIYNYFRLKFEIWILDHPDLADRWEKDLDFDNAEYFYHCNVSGDFMLMHRNAWHSLQAYPEKTYLALHTDALMVMMAATNGLHEKVLPHPIYHQDHARRYNADNAGENGVMREAYVNFQRDAQLMLKQKRAIIYNDNEWGLKGYDLPELVV